MRTDPNRLVDLLAVCDLFYAGGSTNPAWTTVAFYCMAGGIVGALAAAVPGVDRSPLPSTGARGTAIKHMAINLAVVALCLINFWMRMDPPHTPGKLVWLSLISVGLLAISGWLGGKMVFEHGIAVDTPPDAPRR